MLDLMKQMEELRRISHEGEDAAALQFRGIPIRITDVLMGAESRVDVRPGSVTFVRTALPASPWRKLSEGVPCHRDMIQWVDDE